MQALLTTEDIKNFIIETIRGGETVGISELQARVGVSRERINRYVKKGLPWYGTVKRKLFNVEEVIRWFNLHKIKYELKNS